MDLLQYTKPRSLKCHLKCETMLNNITQYKGGNGNGESVRFVSACLCLVCFLEHICCSLCCSYHLFTSILYPTLSWDPCEMVRYRL